MLHTLAVETTRRNQMIDVTARVVEIIRASGLRDGLVICYVPHTTAGVTIQENADPDVVHDILYKLETLIPQDDPQFRHAEGNSDAHIKASLMGASATIPVRAGSPALGTWQAVYFCEFDGPRSRKMHVQLVEA